jgi:hypothetical protein
MDEGQKMKLDESELDAILQRMIDAHREERRSINPGWIANAALFEFDPENKSPALVRASCLTWLRNRSRELLGVTVESAVTEAKAKRDYGAGPYARASTVERLRKEAEAQPTHADRLMDFGARQQQKEQ